MTPAPLLGVGLADTLADLLRQASLPTFLPLMSGRQRWRCLIETLLGHATVRGGRTRDFPFALERIDNTRLTNALATSWVRNFTPGMGESGDYSLLDWLVALHCLVMAWPEQDRSGEKAEINHAAAMRFVLQTLFGQPEVRELEDLLGIAAMGPERHSAPTVAFRRNEAKLAAIAATLAVNNRLESFALRKQDLDRLSSSMVDLTWIRTRKAQTFLDQCKQTFIQRGASFWCSRMASTARDFLLEVLGNEGSPLIDNDAVTILVTPSHSDLPSIEEALDAYFFETIANTRQFRRTLVQRHWPRLLPYFDQALNEGRSTARVMPLLGIEHRRGVNIIDLVRHVRWSDDSDNAEPESQRNIILNPVEPEADDNDHDGVPCSGSRKEARLADPRLAMPTWYHASGGQGYSFPAIAWSLAGQAYTRLTQDTLRLTLRREQALDMGTADNLKALAKVLDPTADTVALIKYDGDSVGARFTALPLLQRPSLSIRLEALIRDAWIDTVARLTRASNTRIPIADLLYFGGDDLLMALPAGLLDTWTCAFDDRLAADPRLPVGLTFTYAARVIRHTVDHRHGTETDDPAAINQCLALAKARRKGLSTTPAEPSIRWTEKAVLAGLEWLSPDQDTTCPRAPSPGRGLSGS